MAGRKADGGTRGAAVTDGVGQGKQRTAQDLGLPPAYPPGGALLLRRLRAPHHPPPPSAPLLALAGAASVWGSGCLEPKAQLPARSQALYTPIAKLRLLLRRIDPNRKRLHHLPQGES